MWLTPTILLRIHSLPILGRRLYCCWIGIRPHCLPTLTMLSLLHCVIMSFSRKNMYLLGYLWKVSPGGYVEFALFLCSLYSKLTSSFMKSTLHLAVVIRFFEIGVKYSCAAGQIGKKFCIIIFIVIYWLMFLLLYIYG